MPFILTLQQSFDVTLFTFIYWCGRRHGRAQHDFGSNASNVKKEDSLLFVTVRNTRPTVISAWSSVQDENQKVGK